MTRAVRSSEALGHEAVIVGYHPAERLNPYQRLLYRHAWRHGLAPVAVDRFDSLPEITALQSAGIRTIFHLHWLNAVLRGAETADDARDRRASFLAELDRYLDAGGRIAWTIHNVLPHGAHLEAEEAALSQAVVDRAAVIHTMAPATPALVAHVMRLPQDRVLEVAHPSYAGAYAAGPTREQARYDLGLEQDDRVALMLGGIRAYKGLELLLDAWDMVAADGRRRLLIAGVVDPRPGVAHLVERMEAHPAILLYPGAVAPEDVPAYFNAADVAVLPYQRELNSGSLMLALTYGLPVVVPRGGPMASIVAADSSRTFVQGDASSLAEALRDADELAAPVAREAARAAAGRYDPDALSDTFCRELRRRTWG